MPTRRETTTRYKNLLYLSIIISTSYEAKNDVTAMLSNAYRRDFEWSSIPIMATRNHNAKPRCETTMRNHDAKPQYETSTLNKNLLYLFITTTTSYEAAKNITTVLKI